MNALLLALAVTAQIDWFPVEPAAVVDIGWFGTETTAEPTQEAYEFPPHEAVNGRVPVWVYVECGPCLEPIKADLAALSLDCAFYYSTKIPPWAKDLPQPILHYPDGKGKGRKFVGFAPGDARKFREQLLESREPTAADRQSRVCYRVRGGWWTVGPIAPGRATIDQVINHLHSAPQHRGKFDLAWLRSLTIAELHSLHSDDHEGRINWASVQRPQAVAQSRPLQRTNCPTCPR